MLRAPIVEPGDRRVLTVSIAVITACLVAALVCVSGSALAWNQSITRRPIVVHVGRLILTAELTIDPTCASLAEDCLIHHRPNRYRYFSMWLYLTTPPNVAWQITDWHLFAVRVGRGDQ